MRTFIYCLCFGATFFIKCTPQQDSQLSLPSSIQGQIPWDLQSMAQAPEHAWEDQQDSVWSMLYSGEHYRGKSTQVFAYYADPSTLSDQPATSDHYPGIILVHGGGGTAFRVWAKQWAQRGYAALAMDLRGSKPLPESEQNHVWGTKSVRLSNGGPTENHQTQFSNIDEPFDEQWQFHAVSNIIRAHSLLRSFNHVDEQVLYLPASVGEAI